LVVGDLPSLGSGTSPPGPSSGQPRQLLRERSKPLNPIGSSPACRRSSRHAWLRCSASGLSGPA